MHCAECGAVLKDDLKVPKYVTVYVNDEFRAVPRL